MLREADLRPRFRYPPHYNTLVCSTLAVENKHLQQELKKCKNKLKNSNEDKERTCLQKREPHRKGEITTQLITQKRKKFVFRVNNEQLHVFESPSSKGHFLRSRKQSTTDENDLIYNHNVLQE